MWVPKSLVHWIEKVVRWCLKFTMTNVIDRCDVVVVSEWNNLTSPCPCEEENIEKASGAVQIQSKMDLVLKIFHLNLSRKEIPF